MNPLVVRDSAALLDFHEQFAQGLKLRSPVGRLAEVLEEAEILEAVNVTGGDASVFVEHMANIAFDFLNSHDSTADVELHSFSDGKWCFVFHGVKIADFMIKARTFLVFTEGD